MKPKLTRVMTISRADFFRLLPKLIGYEIDQLGPIGKIEVPHKGLTLRWQSLPPLTFGAMRLPQLEINLGFEDMYSQVHFMADFDRIYQRGGG
jgi:hypothetical protein